MENETQKQKAKKTYLVSWFYMANHGTHEIRAETPEEAIKQVWAGQTDKIRYVVSEKKHSFIFGSEED